MSMAQKAKPIGRPKKSAGEKRATLIKVLVTADERDRFQPAADQMGVSCPPGLAGSGWSGYFKLMLLLAVF
jgi:hypothetical protein